MSLVFVTGVCYRQGMLAWLLALAVAFLPVSPAFAQDEGGDGGDEQQSSEGDGGGESSSEDGEDGGGRQGGGEDGDQGGDQGGGDQGGSEQSGGDQGGDSSGDGEVGVNIVGDIAADDEADVAPAPRKAARKPKVSKKKVPVAKAAKGRLSRRRRPAVSPVGAPASPTAEAEPQFPELELPDMKEAVVKKEPPPPTAPLVPLPLAFP